MNTEQSKTTLQLLRMLQKTLQKYPKVDEPIVMTDIHIRVNQETGDVMVYNDDDQELTRIVVDEWINNTDAEDEFFAMVAKQIRQLLLSHDVEGADSQNSLGDIFGIIMPYSFVLEDEQGEHIEELFLADIDDTIIIGGPFMQDLEEDLDNFMKHLMDD